MRRLLCSLQVLQKPDVDIDGLGKAAIRLSTHLINVKVESVQRMIVVELASLRDLSFLREHDVYGTSNLLFPCLELFELGSHVIGSDLGLDSPGISNFLVE